MFDRIRSQIQPAALVWAREVRGMPQGVAPKKIGVSVEHLHAFEKGEMQPTLGQLRDIGRVYRKPTAFFYSQALPHKPNQPTDFRRLPEAETGLSPELRDAITRAKQRQKDALGAV
jgi:DNA-binding XRE family transcriptional regulator